MELEAIRRACADVLNVDPNEITEQTTFVEDLGADSLDLYQIIMIVEDNLDVTLDMDSIEDVKDVAQAIAFIKACSK